MVFVIVRRTFVHFFPSYLKKLGSQRRYRANFSVSQQLIHKNNGPPARPLQAERRPSTAHPSPSCSPTRHPCPFPRPQPGPHSVSHHDLSPPVGILRKHHTKLHVRILTIILCSPDTTLMSNSRILGCPPNGLLSITRKTSFRAVTMLDLSPHPLEQLLSSPHNNPLSPTLASLAAAGLMLPRHLFGPRVLS